MASSRTDCGRIAGQSRRLFLGSSVAAAALYTARLGHAEPEDYYSNAFLQELFENNSEDIPPANGGARLTGAQYSDILETIRRGIVELRWAADGDSPDYAHIEEARSDQPFNLRVDDLISLFMASSFPLPASTSDRVLFGLRGCQVAASVGSSSGAAVDLVEAVPDHKVQRCVIGVLDRAASIISVFNASTVPDAAYVYAQAADIEGANLMPTGRYLYEVGTHSWRKPRSRQPGAWRQARSWPVRRIKELPENRVLSYSHGAIWDVPSACGDRPPTGNNIHAGILDASSLMVKFSSAGCQTIPGRYDPRGVKPIGAFAKLREAAGLSSPPNISPSVGLDGSTPSVKTDEDGRKFQYLLLTGREARLASKGSANLAKLRRLRFGSRGSAVRKTIEALRARGHECLASSDEMGMSAVAALVDFQRSTGLTPDGIVSRRVAAQLGIEL